MRDPLQPPVTRSNWHPEPYLPLVICSNPLTDHASRLSVAVAAIPNDQPAAAAVRRQAARIVYQANEHEVEVDAIERTEDRLDHQIRTLLNAITLDQAAAAENRKAADRARGTAAHLEATARNIRAQAAALSR